MVLVVLPNLKTRGLAPRSNRNWMCRPLGSRGEGNDGRQSGAKPCPALHDVSQVMQAAPLRALGQPSAPQGHSKPTEPDSTMKSSVFLVSNTSAFAFWAAKA